MKNFNNLFEQLKKAGRFVSGPAKKPFKPNPQATPVIEAEDKMKGEDPCWKGYEMVGMKNKNGKKVPNCVPTKEEVEALDEVMSEPDYNQSIKARQAAADKKKEDVPFDPPYSKKTSATGGKYGQGYSTARHLARQALQKQLKKPVKESLEESRKAEIVKQASKDAKKKAKEKVSDDKFEAEPTLDSEIIKT